jgi:predicted dithiol-disulfide oxidoreductase (DUF899 family)
MGWAIAWYSSHGSEFNYDFHVTLDPRRRCRRVFHTYSSYGRGGDVLIGTYNWLDLTALGRQEDWEQPAGRSDGPPQHWLRRHDAYRT